MRMLEEELKKVLCVNELEEPSYTLCRTRWQPYSWILCMCCIQHVCVGGTGWLGGERWIISPYFSIILLLNYRYPWTSSLAGASPRKRKLLNWGDRIWCPSLLLDSRHPPPLPPPFIPIQFHICSPLPHAALPDSVGPVESSDGVVALLYLSAACAKWPPTEHSEFQRQPFYNSRCNFSEHNCLST